MFKRIMLFMASGILMLNLSGCFLLAAGVVGGAGTAVWLSGKLSEDFHAPYHRAVDAANAAMHDLGFPIVQESQNENITSIKGTYTDGREIWIDITPVADDSTKIEARVGGVNPDKDAASGILRKIQERL